MEKNRTEKLTELSKLEKPSEFSELLNILGKRLMLNAEILTEEELKKPLIISDFYSRILNETYEDLQQFEKAIEKIKVYREKLTSIYTKQKL